MKVSGNRIVAALGEWMAASDPRRSHPAAPQPAIPLNRFVGVLRAGRHKAARGWQDLRQRELVTADQRQEYRRHGFRFASLSAACSVSASRSANGRSRAAGRAIRTTSYRIPTKRRISSEQPLAGRLPKPAPGTIAVDRALDMPADRHTDPAVRRVDRNREGDQRPPRVDALPAHHLLEVRLPAEPEALLQLQPPGLRREAVAPLAPAVLHHPGAAPRGHATKKAVHTTAIAFLGLIGSLDGQIPPGGVTEPR